MHKTSYDEMRRVLYRYLNPRTKVSILDVGSKVVNVCFPHAYRELMSSAWTYTGCDVTPGPNVDLVMFGPYWIQDEKECYDVVISGQCLEHVERPWVLVREMVRMLRRGGYLILTAPWRWEIHRYPIDCWRVLPDGMRVLLEDANLVVLDTYTVKDDAWAVAQKPGRRIPHETRP